LAGFWILGFCGEGLPCPSAPPGWKYERQMNKVTKINPMIIINVKIDHPENKRWLCQK
jgi:hypothetical protein